MAHMARSYAAVLSFGGLLLQLCMMARLPAAVASSSRSAASAGVRMSDAAVCPPEIKAPTWSHASPSGLAVQVSAAPHDRARRKLVNIYFKIHSLLAPQRPATPPSHPPSLETTPRPRLKNNPNWVIYILHLRIIPGGYPEYPGPPRGGFKIRGREFNV